MHIPSSLPPDPRTDRTAATLTYRPALDGVRAVAVLAVIAYHLGLFWARGGFLGVDIFFVLSGYLITRLLAAEHASTGRVRIGQFWARRARRLFPALALTVIAVATAVRLMRPMPEWPLREADLLWTILYGANWHHISTSQDYFTAFVSASPLRHMWSIAIEEQFYLVWPCLLLVSWRRADARWQRSALLLAIAASAVAIWYLYDPANPTRAYVGTDTRAHELLIGAALAFAVQRRQAAADGAGSSPTDAPVATSLIGALAAIGIVSALVALPDSSRLYYTGGSLVFSLLVAATIWTLEAHPSSLAARTLGSRPMAWIGRISYGLYLWHWPVIVCTPTLLVLWFGGDGLRFVERDILLKTLCLALTFLVSALSYYVVERPIRFGRVATALRPSRLAVFTIALGALTIVGVRAMLRVPENLRAQVVVAENTCGDPVCVVVDAGPRRPLLAVMGDSIALSYGPAFARVARTFGWSFVSGAHNRCSVLHHMVDVPNWEPCYNSVPVTQAAVLSHKPDVIVISDNWVHMRALDENGKPLKSAAAAHVAHVEQGLDALMGELTATGAVVVLMRLVPVSQDIECANPSFERGAPERCGAPARNAHFDLYNAIFDRVAARHPNRVKVIDMTDVLCPKDTCSAKVDGVLVRADRMHFSIEGARWVAPHLQRKLAEVGIRFDL